MCFGSGVGRRGSLRMACRMVRQIHIKRQHHHSPDLPDKCVTTRRRSFPKKNEPAAQAQRAVSAMTLEERVGQLVMVPLLAGSDPSSLASTIADEHIGSAILIGNWNTSADTVKTATAQLRICAGRQSSHHRHRSGGWSGAASDWYRFRHNAQCR